MSVLTELTDISETPLPIVALEDNVETTQDKDQPPKFIGNSYKFDKAVVEKFNQLYAQITIKEAVVNSVKLDRAIACEVFTMLGDKYSTEPGKLTSAPSINNKQITEKALSSISDKPEIEMLDTLTSFKDQVNVNIEKINNLRLFLQTLRQSLNGYDAKFKNEKPMVIYYGKSFNLYTDTLGDLLSIDDTAIDYPKYNNALHSKLYAVVDDEVLKNYVEQYLTKDQSSYTLAISGSLEFFVNKIFSIITLLDQQVSGLLDYKDELANTLNLDNSIYTESLSKVVNELPTQIDSFNHINTFSDIINNENSFVTKLEDLLKFID